VAGDSRRKTNRLEELVNPQLTSGGTHTSKKKKDPEYVLRAECLEISGGIKTELTIIKKALVGEDMRGGLVKQVNELTDQVARMQESKKLQEARHWKLKFALFGLLMTIIGIIIEQVISRL